MEETINPSTETTIEETAVHTEPVENAAPATPIDQLNALLARRNGQFDLSLSYADLKSIKNLVNQKIEWKGPNEAYLVIMTLLTIDSALEAMDPKNSSPVKIQLPASTLESVNFFLTKVTGKGLESAQRVFSMAMQLRKIMEVIHKLDEEINSLKSEIESEKK